MSILAFNYIDKLLTELGINYQFGTWTTDPVPNPYFVGEYNESPSLEREENGYQETTLMITGTGTSWYDLEKAKETIEKNVSKTAILENGNGLAIFYNGSLIVPVEDKEFKRIQINLLIKEWRI